MYQIEYTHQNSKKTTYHNIFLLFMSRSKNKVYYWVMSYFFPCAMLLINILFLKYSNSWFYSLSAIIFMLISLLMPVAWLFIRVAANSHLKIIKNKTIAIQIYDEYLVIDDHSLGQKYYYSDLTITNLKDIIFISIYPFFKNELTEANVNYLIAVAQDKCRYYQAFNNKI